MINLNYLRYFYICAQCGSFTKAAAKLNISQPSLSIQIKNFESQLGFPLFVRAGRSLQLTPRGQGLFLYASKMFEVTDDIQLFLSDSLKEKGNTLKIGVSDEVERPFVADIVGKLIRANTSSSLTPSIISKKHDEVVHLVAHERVDLLLTNQKTSQLKLVEEFKIPVMLISTNSSAQHKVHSQNIQNILKEIEQDLVLPSDEMILAKETGTFLKSRKAEVKTVLTSNILACIVRAVQEQLGAAFLPVAYVNRELRSGLLQAYGPRDGFWQHTIYLYTNKGNMSKFTPSLAKILRDTSVLKYGVQEIDL